MIEETDSRHTAILGIGSNKKYAAEEAVGQIIVRLRELYSVDKESEIYTTRPFGKSFSNLNDYKNAVIELTTLSNLSEFEAELKELEKDFGRDRGLKSDEVAADIDIVIWDGKILRPREVDRDYLSIGYNQILGDVETSS